MPGKLFLTQFGCQDPTAQLFDAILESDTAPADILYLCPSPRKLRDVQLRFFNQLARPAVVPPNFTTPSQLARELHERYGSGRRFPTELKPLLLRRLLSPIRRRPLADSLLSPDAVGKPLTPTLGHASAVATFIRDVKSYVSPSELPSLKSKLTELLAGFATPCRRALEALEVMQRYNELLQAKGWVDSEDILAAAPELVRTHLRPRLLVLDSFVAPNRLEQELLLALIEKADTTLAMGYHGPGDEYRIAAGFCDQLRQQAGLAAFELPSGPPASDQRLVAFPTLEEEIAGICRSIRDRGQTINLAETVVTLPSLTDCAPVVHRVFEQYGIPVTLYPETSLASSPPVIAIIELLTALDTGYERIATTAAFSSPYLPGLLRPPGEKDSTNRDRAAAMLNHYSRRGGIIKDRLNWWHIAERVAAAEDRQLADVETALLRDLQARVRQAIGLTEKLLEPADTAGNQAKRLKQFLEATDFCGNLISETDNELLVDRKTVYDLLDSITALDAEFGERPEPREEFIRALRSLLTSCKRQPDPVARGVIVTTIAETLGLYPSHLYIAGLTENNLHSSPAADSILPDSTRRALGMPDYEWHRDYQRFHLCRTLASAQETPFLSFHDSADGKPVLPTPFLAVEVTKPAFSGVAYSPAEIQIARGEQTGKHFADRTQPVDFSNDSTVKAELAQRFGRDRPLSVTSLENYRRCPYQFYFEHVLGLDTPPEPTYDVDAQQWGRVVHCVLEKLYEHGSVPLNAIEQRATAILEDVLRETNLPQFWQQVTRRVFANILPGFVECEATLRRDGFVPVRSESSVSGHITPDIMVRGRLDRLDASEKAVRILDYKTGSTNKFSPKAVVEKRTQVQLPLYAKLVHDKESNRVVDNMGIYSLRDLRIVWFAGNDYTVDQLIQAAVANTVEIVAGIRSGRFPAVPSEDDPCRHCTLGHTCGRQEPKKTD